MKQISKILLVLSIMAILAGTAIGTDRTNQIINGTINQTTSDAEIATRAWSPWDSSSIAQSTNTKNVFMKIDYIPQTEWIDIEGYYDQLNYFQLPITVKLVNGANLPIKNQNVNVYIDEYQMWWEGGWFTCNCWRYQYKTTYANKKNTGTSGNTEFLFSLPYKGYDRVFYKIQVSYKGTNTDYAYYKKNIRGAWYINTKSAKDIIDQINRTEKVTDSQ
jgi:hypothetical protein